MKKRIFLAASIAAAVFLAIALGTGVRSYADGHHVANHCVCGAEHLEGRTHAAGESASEITWTGVSEIPLTSGTHYVYLTADITVSSQMSLAADETLYLCLNGHSITGNGSRVFMYLNSGSKLVLTDCSGEIGTDGLPKGRLVSSYSGASGNDGSCIYLRASRNGVFDMYQGTLLHTGASLRNGGVVYVNATTTFNMYGGVIAGGTAVQGGGVYMQGGAFNLYDGTIRECLATQNGGAVMVTSGGAFHMYGGSIGGTEVSDEVEVPIGSTAGARGGSVYVTNGTLTMDGGYIETGKTTSTTAGGGGNVALVGSSAEFILNDGALISGSAQFGGNLWIAGGAKFTMNGGSLETGISTGGSSADAGFGENYGGGNLCLSSGTATVTEGMIFGGTSVNSKNNTRGNNINLYNGTLTFTGGMVEQWEDGASSWNIDVAGSNGVLNLNGGQIRSQKAGNIFLMNGTLNMTDGIISNEADEPAGANLYVSKTANISGGTISRGYRSAGGGNIFVNGSGAHLTITGDPVIELGTANNGGNLSVASGTVEIEGGTFISGSVPGYGGNVAATGGTITIGHASFTEGTARCGGHIYLTGTSVMTIDGAEFSDGLASDTGDAIYLWQVDENAETKPELTIGNGTLIDSSAGTNAAVTVSGGMLTVNGGTIKGGSTAILLGAKANTAFAMTDGFVTGVESVGNPLPALISRSISGGMFVNRADDALVEEGKTSLCGTYENTEREDDETVYRYCIDEESSGVFVDASVDIDYAGLSLSVSGADFYRLGEPFELRVSTVDGLTFEGWYDGETLVGTEETLTGVASAEVSYTARFVHDPEKVLVTVKADFFSYYKNDKWEIGFNRANFFVTKGAEIILRNYINEEPITMWVNESKKLLAESDFLETTIYTDSYFEAITTSPGTVVFFLTEYDQIYATAEVIGGAFYGEIPAVPLRIGATAHWDKSIEEIIAEGSKNRHGVQVRLVVTPKEDPTSYTVTVLKDGESVFTKEAAIGKSVPVSIPETENFLCVKDGEKVISYSPVFDYKATENKTLTAVYGEGEEQSVIHMTASYGTKGGMIFAAVRSVKEEDELIEQGILYSLTPQSEAAFVKGSAGVGAAVSNSDDKHSVTSLNLKTSETKTVYARGYMILKHEDGTTETVYAEIVSATSGENEAVQPEKNAEGVVLMANMRDVMKTFGRTMFFEDGSMLNDWTNSGFEVNVRSAGTGFTVVTRAEYDVYYVVEIDGTAVDRPLVNESADRFTVNVPAGDHSVRVIKDSEVDASGKKADLIGVIFDGQFLAKPANGTKKVEIIGDSISSGKGSLGVYDDNAVWTNEEHSGTHSFSYFITKELNWDTNVISRGGIGLVTKIGGKTSADLYPYVSGYRDGETLYNFKESVPDLIILELSSNDGSANAAVKETAYRAFLSTLRETYPRTPIVWVGKAEDVETIVNRWIADNSDQNAYACRVEYGGSGSKAVLSQTSGHPNAEEQMGIAVQLREFLQERGLID